MGGVSGKGSWKRGAGRGIVRKGKLKNGRGVQERDVGRGEGSGGAGPPLRACHEDAVGLRVSSSTATVPPCSA